MRTYVALLRGINVGGHNTVPMKELVGVLAALGFEGVTTYIQSGNAVFDAEEAEPKLLAKRIRAAVGERFGFEPEVMVLRRGDLARAIQSNPFEDADPRRVMVYFLGDEPVDEAGARAAAERMRAPDESLEVTRSVFYLHAPSGIGRSKLAASVEKLLGVRATARNMRTVAKIGEIVGNQR